MSEVMITLDLDVKPEAIDAVCAGLPDMLKDTAQRPGFIEIRVVREADSNHMLFVERWASEQAYHDYLAWRTERGDMEGFAAALNAPLKMTIWPVSVATA